MEYRGQEDKGEVLEIVTGCINKLYQQRPHRRKYREQRIIILQNFFELKDI
jgi:hypothetical protein